MVKADAAITVLVNENDEHIEADVFVEATGTAGPQPNCAKNGNGCAMCVLRCPSFDGRVIAIALNLTTSEASWISTSALDLLQGQAEGLLLLKTSTRGVYTVFETLPAINVSMSRS